MDITQSVVTRVAATEFHLGFAGYHIELIMDHQNFFGLNFEKFGQCRYRFPDRFMNVAGFSSQMVCPSNWVCTAQPW